VKHALVSYSILSVLAGSIGCEQLEAPATPLTCSFALLNEQGQPTTVFAQGQNIVFQFQITNPTEQDVLLQNPPIETADFLVVTRQTSGEGVAALGKLRWSRLGAQKQDVYFLSHERKHQQVHAG